MRRSIPSSLGWMVQPPITFQSLKKAESSTSLFLLSSSLFLSPSLSLLFSPPLVINCLLLGHLCLLFTQRPTSELLFCSFKSDAKWGKVTSLIRSLVIFSRANIHWPSQFASVLPVTIYLPVCQSFMAGSILGVSCLFFLSPLFTFSAVFSSLSRAHLSHFSSQIPLDTSHCVNWPSDATRHFLCAALIHLGECAHRVKREGHCEC